MKLLFDTQRIQASFLSPSGNNVQHEIEVRTSPITFRTCRITHARLKEKDPGTEKLPPKPPEADNPENCPFCHPQLLTKTPMIDPDLYPNGRMRQGESVLFPNLFPYGKYSAVSLFDNDHFVEIGKATLQSYTNSFKNCAGYLKKVLEFDRHAIHMAITQNHLPSAGGSLIHPHFQIQADKIPSNNHRFLKNRTAQYFQETGGLLFSDYLNHEKNEGSRYVGKTGDWEWVAAFAPEGFFELWGILPGKFSITRISGSFWEDLSKGILNAQRFYRSLFRNGYNLGILSIEDESDSMLELRCVMLVRSNYAPWARNDHTGFEVMLGDMATFSSPEETARKARRFWD
ncbi:MAG: galactose-1-phosphate uridylyltransferase [Desulfobacterales bacterium]|nr:galactose-1-phosphate uridylyltransferase [Desulfobacterales bacterium]